MAILAMINLVVLIANFLIVRLRPTRSQAKHLDGRSKADLAAHS